MDIVSDTYIRGGIPQSRYCRSCAHYQVLSGCSNSKGEPGARVCLYILDTGHRRGCLPGPGCDKHITFAQWCESKRGRAVLRQKRSQSRPRKRRAAP
jgi:hypothetical protein